MTSPAPPVFVCGTQRSGTTLLCRMLSAHSQLHVENEIQNVQEKFAQARDANDIVAAINREKRLDERMRETGKTRWGLKDPLLTYCLPRLAELFPDSPVLILKRDGRAVTNSHLKSGFGAVNNVYAAAMRWKEEVGLHRAYSSTHSDRALFVDYDRLVLDPEETLRQVSQFLGIEFEEGMCQYAEKPTFINKNALNENVFKPLDTGKVEGWKTQLSARQIRVFESVAGDELVQSGYELVGKPSHLSLPVVCFYRAHQGVMERLNWQRRKVSGYFKKRNQTPNADSQAVAARNAVGE